MARDVFAVPATGAGELKKNSMYLEQFSQRNAIDLVR
jgi:hypothetical protein